MYEQYFGFAEKPFGLTPDPRYLYRGERRRSALDAVQYGVRHREGLMLVTGEAGTGKTSLCRALLDRCGRDTFASLVLNPFLSSSAGSYRRHDPPSILIARAAMRPTRIEPPWRRTSTPGA